jgi:hypothetical protein
MQAAQAAATKKAQGEAAAAEKKVRGLLPFVGVKQSACATRHPPLQAAAAARIAGKPDIIAAATSGDLALVQDHLTVDPSCVLGRPDWTPLHRSAACGHLEITRLLLQCKADVNAKATHGG